MHKTSACLVHLLEQLAPLNAQRETIDQTPIPCALTWPRREARGLVHISPHCSWLSPVHSPNPNPAVQNAQGARPKASWWYGQEPHVPLVHVDSDGRITSESDDPEKDCRQWAQIGSRWFAIDAWGQLLGPQFLRKRMFNPDSHCFEVEFSEPKQGGAITKDAAVLYASSGWTSVPSVKWAVSLMDFVDELRRRQSHYGALRSFVKRKSFRAVINLMI